MDKERDKKFMNNPDAWPLWPLLPLVKRNGGEPFVGLLKATKPPTFLEGANLYGIGEPGYEEKFAPRVVTAEQLLEEGWEVD